MRRGNVVLCVLLAIPLSVAGVVDLTVENFATGTDVVLATVSRLESAQIFASDNRLLRRIAYVETDDGRRPPPLAPFSGSGSSEQDQLSPLGLSRTARQSSLTYGGIWNVDSASFDRTITDEALVEKRAEVATAFPEVGDWREVVWEDLSRPLWSALAARLVIFLAENSTEIPAASDVPGQALFWRNVYNNDGDPAEFERRVNSLIEEERCRVKADMIFLMDSSGSVKRRNFRRMRQFVHNFADSLDIAPNATQVGVILFNDNAWIAFNLSTFSEKPPLLAEIDSLPYIKGYTNTADALCLLLEEGFSEEGGARLSADDVFSIAIVITDGVSNRNSSRCDNATTYEVAESIHNSSHAILLFAVGVTDEVNEQELLAIASREEYVTYLEDFSDSAFGAARDEQLYDLCTKTTIPVETGSSLTGSLEEGGQVRYHLLVPPGGLSLNICVSQGEVQLYGSSKVPNPNSALNDFELLVNSTSLCVNVTIEGYRESASGSGVTGELESLFISLEGRDSVNDFSIVVSAIEPLPDDEGDNEGGSGEPDVSYPTEDKSCFGLSCVLIIVLIVVSVTVFIALVAACALCLALLIRRKKRRKKGKKRNQVGVVSDEQELLEPELSSKKHSYSPQFINETNS